MWTWVLVMMLVGRMIAEAGTCATDPDGSSCLLIDGQTTGICKGGACTRTFTVPAGEARTGTGTISSSGGTVTGSGTAFLSEVSVGDVLTASGEVVAVTLVTSDTALTTTPSFFPALSAGTSFTISNPPQKIIDSSGNPLVVIDARGFVSIGTSGYAQAPLNVAARTASPGLSGSIMSIIGMTGGPATSSAAAGAGSRVLSYAGAGGSSAISGKAAGAGGLKDVEGGAGGSNTAGSGAKGGDGNFVGGPGGCGSSGNTTGSGGDAHLSGGIVGVSCASTGGSVGNTLLGENGGQTQIGNAAQTVLDNTTGGFTKIRSVTVSAFPPANAAGFLKNDGSGNYSLAAIAPTDLPASVQNAVNAFVHANAGGI